MGVLDKKKVKLSIVFLTIFIVLMIRPYGPINNIGHSLPRLSFIHDIAIHSPEATTYDGPMSGHYPAIYGFEDVDDGSMPDDWEYSSTASVVSEKSGHKKVLDLYDISSLNSVTASMTFSKKNAGKVEFWVCISTTSKEGYIKLYDKVGVQIELRLFDGDISYLEYRNSDHYVALETYDANVWYHIQIIWNPKDPFIGPVKDYSGFYILIDGIFMNDVIEGKLVKFENLYGPDPEIKKLSFETHTSSFFYHFYVDAIGNSWDSDYDYGTNRCEGIYISFSCSTPLIAVAYSLDGGSWVNIFPYYRIVIPMRIGGGTHTIQICGDDQYCLIHVSSIRTFTIAELLDWGVDAINAEFVWGGSEDAKDVQVGNPAGQGVNVLVIDTGIDVDHPDLVSNYKGGYDFSAGDSIPDDEVGHGTHCSGIIGAADNSIGVLGVAPKVNLYAARAVDLNNQEKPNITAVNEAIYWAINTHDDTDAENDIHIISMSIGLDDHSIDQACQDAYNAGIVLVAASGNDLVDYISYPAKNQHVIGIGAVKPKGDKFIRMSFSNYGDGLELVAPGFDIFSTFLDDNYKHAMGTSMACPMVAGVCALLLSKKPTLSHIEVREALTESARDDLCFNYNYIPEEYGHGLVDAQGALNYNFEGEVEITSPSDGSSFYRGQNIKFQAYAFDHDILSTVQYRINTGNWQDATYNTNTNRWEWTWSNTNQYNAGWYTITCKSTDQLGCNNQDSISIQLKSTGGCPILSVFNGNEYIEEGLLDIHNPDGIDEIYEHILINQPLAIDNRYYLRLTEHNKTISHIDKVELWGELANGQMIKLPLLSAIHCDLGEVRRYLLFSDDRKIDELGADHNNGISQSIDLKFLAPQGLNFNKFIFVIEGNNALVK